MRFMLIHKTNASNEAGLRPPQELIAGVGRTIREMQETGIFRDGAGLRASSLGARLEGAREHRERREGRGPAPLRPRVP